MSRPLSILVAAALLAGCNQKKIAALEGELADRDAALASVRAENQGYVLELEALRAELHRLKRESVELASLYARIVDEFGPQIEGGRAWLVVYGDRTVVAVGEQIWFESGSAALDETGKLAVARLGEVLREHPGRRFQVEGHTDPLPIATERYPSNWELGASRAITVVKALVAAGVPATQLSAASYADTTPFATNSHENGQAVNRRITVTLQTTLEDTGAQRQLYAAAQKHGRALRAAVDGPSPTIATTR